jgi:hypothetical protein
VGVAFKEGRVGEHFSSIDYIRKMEVFPLIAYSWLTDAWQIFVRGGAVRDAHTVRSSDPRCSNRPVHKTIKHTLASQSLCIVQ